MKYLLQCLALMTIFGTAQSDVMEMLSKGDTAMLNQEIHKAVKYYRLAYRDKPDSFAANLGLARCYFKMGRDLSAGTMIEKVLLQDTNHVEAILMRVKISIRQGRYDEAISDLNIIAELRPDDIDAYILKRTILYNVGRVDEAKAINERVNELISQTTQ